MQILLRLGLTLLRRTLTLSKEISKSVIESPSQPSSLPLESLGKPNLQLELQFPLLFRLLTELGIDQAQPRILSPKTLTLNLGKERIQKFRMSFLAPQELQQNSALGTLGKVIRAQN